MNPFNVHTVGEVLRVLPGVRVQAEAAAAEPPGLSSGSTMFYVPANASLNDNGGNGFALAANGATLDTSIVQHGAGSLLRDNVSGGSEWTRAAGNLALPQGPYYTVEAWLRHTGGLSTWPMHQIYVNDAAMYPLAMIAFANGPHIAANVYDSTGALNSVFGLPVSFPPSAWRHVALSVYGTHASLYFHGARVASFALSASARSAFRSVQAWGNPGAQAWYDDIRVVDWNPYQGESYTLPGPGPATEELLSSYEADTTNTWLDFHAGYFTRRAGQMIQAPVSATLTKAAFKFWNLIPATGNSWVEVWAYGTGTYGTDAKPTGTPGTPLATSDIVNLSGVATAGKTWVEYTFSGANQIALSSGTVYGFTLYNSTTSPIRLITNSTGAGPGNMAYLSNTNAWNGSPEDVLHRLYGIPAVIV